MRRYVLILVASCFALTAAALVTAPGELHNDRPAAAVPAEDLDRWLEEAEAAVHRRTPLIPGTGKRVRWADPEGRGDDVRDGRGAEEVRRDPLADEAHQLARQDGSRHDGGGAPFALAGFTGAVGGHAL